jgi:GT2 family glycosyltransferase
MHVPEYKNLPDLLTISVVLYNTPEDDIKTLLKSIFLSDLPIKVFLIFNSPSSFTIADSRIFIVRNSSNLGFGSAHNLAFADKRNSSKYSLVLNPDIYFNPGTLESLVNFMDNNEDVGLCMPKIFYPDKTIQYLCKLLPTPFDLFLRRFIPTIFFSSRRAKYELRFTDYNHIMDIPFLSGSFMFLRTSLVRKLGGFDPRFFMYMEDADLCRRVLDQARAVFYPHATAYHGYDKGSYRQWRLLYFHLRSAFLYFNKWGWFVDNRRKEINQAALSAHALRNCME